MKNIESSKYSLYLYSEIIKIAPVMAAIAAVQFTLCYAFGLFKNTKIIGLVTFDVFCLIYILMAIALKLVFKKSGDVKPWVIYSCKTVIALLVVLQWNLMSYIFPSQDIWGYAPLYLIVVALFFDSRLTAITAIVLLVSTALSWLMMGSSLLPSQDELFMQKIILRITALPLSLGAVCMMSFFGEKMLVNADRNTDEMKIRAKKLKDMSDEIITFTADIIEQRDQSSGAHVKRVGKYTKILVKTLADNYPKYHLDDEDIELISNASKLHDIGKIYIPDDILNKPDTLSSEEKQMMKRHTEIGEQIAYMLPEEMSYRFKKYTADICLYHHERVDGSGYPQGLAGDQIPVAAQIVSVADCFDALTSERPYKDALSTDESIDMIISGQCGKFSEEMAKILKMSRDELEETRLQCADL